MSHASCIRWFLVLFISLSTLQAEKLEEFVFENPPFASCHASTLTETSSGTLLCSYFGGTDEGATDVGIWLSERTDKGWSIPRLIAQEEDVPAWNPVLFTLPSGEILLFYKLGENPRSWSGMLKRSSDDGKSWSQEESLPAGVIGPVKNKPLIIGEKTLLCPSSIETWHRWGCWMDITSDAGKTWTKSSPINLKSDLYGIIQPTIFLTSEGNLRLLARSRMGRICTALSKDGGKTWTEALPTELPNPDSGIDAVRLPSGQILLVYNHAAEERTPLNVALSDDGGIHWKPLMILESAAGEYSYPYIIQTKDGKIHISYTYNRKKIKYFCFEPSDLGL